MYLNALDLRFNPFANIVDIKESAESIRNLLVVLANPSGDCDDTFMSLLLKAVQEVWDRKENEALIDDIVQFMQEAIQQPEYRDTTTVRARMEEIIVGLDKYCSREFTVRTSTVRNHHWMTTCGSPCWRWGAEGQT
nr:hypothetical protein [Escherichia coli]